MNEFNIDKISQSELVDIRNVAIDYSIPKKRIAQHYQNETNGHTNCFKCGKSIVKMRVKEREDINERLAAFVNKQIK